MIIFKFGSGRRSSIRKRLLNNLAFSFGLTLTSRIFSLLGALSNYTCYHMLASRGCSCSPLNLWLKQLCYSPAKKKQQTQNGVMVHFMENFGVTKGFWKLCECGSPRVSALYLSLWGLWAVVTSVLAGSQPL